MCCGSAQGTMSFDHIKEDLEELGLFLQQTVGELSKKTNLSTATWNSRWLHLVLDWRVRWFLHPIWFVKSKRHMHLAQAQGRDNLSSGLVKVLNSLHNFYIIHTLSLFHYFVLWSIEPKEYWMPFGIQDTSIKWKLKNKIAMMVRVYSRYTSKARYLVRFTSVSLVNIMSLWHRFP